MIAVARDITVMRPARRLHLSGVMAVIASEDTTRSVAEAHTGPREQAGAAIRRAAYAASQAARPRHAGAAG